jgi:hypothetical protein
MRPELASCRYALPRKTGSPASGTPPRGARQWSSPLKACRTDPAVTAPGWLGAGFAALMILVAACSAGRLAAARARGRDGEPDVDVLHLLMGVVMAGMFEPGLHPLPGAICQAVFAAGAAWFACRASRALSRGAQARARWKLSATHAVECAAMIYMLLPSGSPPANHASAAAMPGMTGSGGAYDGNPALALLLALFLLGYVIWTADGLADMSRGSKPRRPQDMKDRLTAATHQAAMIPRPAPPNTTLTHPGGPSAAAPAPRLAACYKIAMGITMGYMLVTML